MDVVPLSRGRISRSCNKAALNRVATQATKSGHKGFAQPGTTNTHDSGGSTRCADPAFSRRLLDWQIALARTGWRQPRRAQPALPSGSLRTDDGFVVRIAGARGHRGLADVSGCDHRPAGHGPTAGVRS